MTAAGRAVGMLRGRAGPAVLSQGVAALSSLVLQVVAARTLGLSGYGAYVVCFGVLVTVTAVFTGFVGDSLTVLDRFDPLVRGALSLTAAAGIALGALVCGVVASAVRHGGPGAGVAFALAAAAWLAREVGRRILTARLSYWLLTATDTIAVVVTLGTLTVLLLTAPGTGLAGIFAAIAVGNVLAGLVGLALLPAAERRPTRPGTAGLARVAGFASWRALQVGLRPGTLVVVRLLVAATGGLAGVGLLEAGRLILAPVQTVVNSAGSVLLAGGAAARRQGRGASEWTGRAAVLLVAGALAGGAVGAVFADPLGRLVIGRPAPVGLVVGWAVFLAVAAATLPYATEVTVQERSRTVFAIRLADSLTAIGLVVVLGLAGLAVAWVPWAMAVSGAGWFLALRAVAHACRRSAAQPDTATEAPARARGAGWST